MEKAESKYKGAAVYTRVPNVNVYEGPGPSTKIVKTYPTTGTKLGYIYAYHPAKINNEFWYIIIPDITLSNIMVYVPLSSFTIKTDELPTKGEIEKLINLININNILIYKRLLVTLEIINRLKVVYKNDAARLNKLLKVAETAANVGHNLQNNIDTLNSMKNYLTVKTWFDDRYEELKKSVGLSGLGAAPVLLVFGIGAAVTATVITLLYFVLKPTYDSSTANLIISEGLSKALDSLTPQEKKEVLSDLEKQIDDAYNQGKTDQKIDDTGGSFITVIKWSVVGLLGYKLIDLISNHKSA